MSANQPPAGWSVELLGLIGAVQFDNGSRRLLWSDGEWRVGHHGHDGIYVTAPGVPAASSMAEARRVGCEWLRMVEGVAA